MLVQRFQVKNTTLRLTIALTGRKERACGSKAMKGNSMANKAAQIDSLPAPLIREALQQIIDSREFSASDRLRRLLSFLVEETLAGRQKTLNQRELATAIFDRSADFDPELDPIVRVEMSKLRKSLKSYYASANGPHSLRFSIPRGRYVPMIEPLAGATEKGASTKARQRANVGPDPARRQTLLIRPFAVFSHHRNGIQVAESLTDELEVVLARLPGLRVVSHPDDLGDGEHPGFVLHGTVKCENTRLRINVRLLEGRGSEILWTERFEHQLDEMQTLDFLDLVTLTVLARVADVYSGTISQSLVAALDLSKKSSFSSAEAMLFFYRYINMHSDESYATARRAVEDAWSRDSDNAIMTALLADVRRAGYSLGYVNDGNPLPECLELARRALTLAPESAACKLSLGFALLNCGRRAELLELTEDLLADSMLSPGYRGEAGMLLAFAGQWQRGCSVLDSVLSVLKLAPHSFSYPRFLSAYREGNYAAALAVAERFRPSPLFWQPMMRAAALGQTGERALAEQALHALLKSRPQFPQLGYRWLSCFLMDPALVDHLIEGLRKGGLATV